MTTIAALQRILSAEGPPCKIVTDNGSQFTFFEFQLFCEQSIIEHLTTTPFHPASNGLAERFVSTFKEDKYLATYGSTPNPVTGKSPADLLHGRQPQTVLSEMFSKYKLIEYIPDQNVG